MDKIEEAKQILKDVGMPKSQQSDLCGYTLLAMAGLTENEPWSGAENEWIRIHDIIQFLNKAYHLNYAENSRETFRKQALHHFRTAALVEDNGKSTNSPNYRYRLTPEFLELIQQYSTAEWDSSLRVFQGIYGRLTDLYASKKQMNTMPVTINDIQYTFSSGMHNDLQKAILEEFAPRFAPGSICLYVGDTTKRDLVKDEPMLKELGFDITLHDKMPDVVLYQEDRDWLYFIEAVTSVGPMSPARILEINEMTKDVSSGKIFVTAFPDFKTYKKFSEQIAWETEVWIADNPEHMIHLNGNKFLGPR